MPSCHLQLRCRPVTVTVPRLFSFGLRYPREPALFPGTLFAVAVSMPAKRKSGGGEKGSKEKAPRVSAQALEEQPYIPKCVAWFLGCERLQ